MAVKLYIPKGKNVLMARYTVSINNKIVCDTRIRLQSDLTKQEIKQFKPKKQVFEVGTTSLGSEARKSIIQLDKQTKAYLDKVKDLTNKAKLNGLPVEYIRTIPKVARDGIKIKTNSSGRNLNQLYYLVLEYIDVVADVAEPQQYLSQSKHVPKDLLVSDFDYTQFNALTIALAKKKVGKKSDRNLAKRTIEEVVKLIKSALRHAKKIDKNITIVEGILDFRMKKNLIPTPYLKKDYIISLKESEIERIRNAKLQGKAEQIRQILLFSIESGLRSIDALRIVNSKNKSHWIDLNTGSGSKARITLSNSKTKRKVVIPIDRSVAEMIMDIRPINYQNYMYHLNRTCKEIGLNRIVHVSKQSGAKLETMPLYDAVGTHIGRRTYASIRYGKVPVEAIMQVTGHVDLKNFLKYIGIETDDALTRIMEDYEKERLKNG